MVRMKTGTVIRWCV